MDKQEKYIVTKKQLADIVSYCVQMTITGSGSSKDWTYNVETAIGENGCSYRMDHIKLKKYKPSGKEIT